jgi:hypothetical protein
LIEKLDMLCNAVTLKYLMDRERAGINYFPGKC